MATGTSTTTNRAFRPLLLVVLLLPAAIFLHALSLVLLAALVPTLVARILDTGRPPFLTLTVGCANLVGALYFVEELWNIGPELENVGLVLSDAIGWLAVLGAVGAGWLMFICFPLVVHALAQGQSGMRLRRMRRDQQRLIEEWGPEVADEKEKAG